MTFRVRLSTLAQDDLSEAESYILSQSGTRAAARWVDGLINLIDSLQEMPLRFGSAPESEVHGAELRQAIYHSHRILFRVHENEVRILRIYHSRRDELHAEDLG